MSRYDHKIETSLEGIEHLSKDYKHQDYEVSKPFINSYFPNSSKKEKVKMKK